MRIENTLSDGTEEFDPDDPVQIYYCGLTVSDSPHLGHARGWVHTDVFRRFLEHRGYNVRHVENITDVNEKIFNRLGEEGIDEESEQELADRFAREVLDSMSRLNLRRADVYPRVSNHISEIIDLVESLVESGYAYESNGSVYFDVNRFDDYGDLSNQSLDDIESQGESKEISDKHSEHDFALWKAVKPNKTRGNVWDSPWGYGRPGWHIECSAMSSTHLELPIDVHIGGQDLVFPHHENEIAQSESAEGTEFADSWMHIRLLNSGEDSEKMSSSRNNFKTVNSAINEYGVNAVRWFLLSSNYDSEQLYSEDKIEQSRSKWNNVRKTYEMLKESLGENKSDATKEDQDVRREFSDHKDQIEEFLSDNLNTRKGLNKIEQISKLAQNYLKDSERYDQGLVMDMISFYEDTLQEVFGFSIEKQEDSDEGVVDSMINYRDELRDSSEFEKADVIRDALNEAGYEIEDTAEGTVVVDKNMSKEN